MNKRIKQLLEQATTIEVISGRGVDTTQYIDRFDEQKFTELIVKEMCGLMEQAEDDAYHCFEPSERPTEYIDWLVNWRTQFEKHFGVEK